MLFLLRVNNNVVATKKMNEASVIPKIELVIILGSTTNNVAPTRALFSPTNFTHKKNNNSNVFAKFKNYNIMYQLIRSNQWKTF